MPFEFKLPDLGEGVHEAQLLTWKVAAGEHVTAFQPLCEVESAKAAVELTTPVAGRVLETRFAEGDIAQRGDVLVLIETEAASDAPAPAPEQEPWFGIVGRPPPNKADPPARVLAAPFVRKLARDRGLQLENIVGSGPHGRVRIADIEAQTTTDPLPQPAAVPWRGLRRSIADHMVEAWRNAPQVTSMDLFDVTELVRARDLLAPGAQQENTRLTYLPFFVKAAIQGLTAVPEANATVGADGSELSPNFHIGIATSIQGGLVVPVVRHADRLTLLELAVEIDRLVKAARERRATPTELSGSTFTITSFGGLPGSPMFATPIVNYPEVAILGVGRIDLQPRVVDGAVVARHCAGVSFTFDHRVLDGEGAGRFMAALKRYVEQPLELLLRLR